MIYKFFKIKWFFNRDFIAFLIPTPSIRFSKNKKINHMYTTPSCSMGVNWRVRKYKAMQSCIKKYMRKKNEKSSGRLNEILVIQKISRAKNEIVRCHSVFAVIVNGFNDEK